MEIKKLVIILIIVLFSLFLITFVDSASYEYNFNATFQGTTMFAEKNDVYSGSCVGAPPPTTLHSPGCDWSDVSTSSNLDSSDDSRESTQSTASESGSQLFFADLSSLDRNDITFFNWSWEGSGDALGNTIVYFYLWNISSDSPYECAPSTNSVADVTRNCTSNGLQITNFINSTGFIHFKLMDNGQTAFDTDYIQLNVKTLPSISIISPTTNQFFTNAAPTTTFNLTTTGSSDECRWSPDEGVTNYTMDSQSSTAFDLINSTMVDGNYTIKYFCNDSDSGRWFNSSLISFQVDPINITQCRDLTIEDRIYELQSNISSDYTCLNVSANNITIEGNDYYIFFAEVYEGFGIYAENWNSTNISNLNIHGNNLSTDNSPAIRLKDNTGNVIDNININISGTASSGIHISGTLFGGQGETNITSTNIVTTGQTDTYGLYTTLVEQECYIKHSNFTANNGESDINLAAGNTLQFYFINSSFDKEEVSSGELHRKWYFDMNVTYANATGVNGANVTVYNVSNSIIFSVLTGSDGLLTTQEFIDYINNAGTRTSSNIHGINITFSGYTTNASTLNMTSNQDLQRTLKVNAPPTIFIDSPTNDTNQSLNTLDITFTVSDDDDSLDSCWWTNNTGINNYTITCGDNITSETWNEGERVIDVYANDSAGNINTSSVTFVVDTIQPFITISYPANTSYTSSVTELNYSANDLTSGVFSVWYSTDLGVTNSSVVTNFSNFTVTASEGSNTWHVYVNDSTGNQNETSVTFSVDTIFPTVMIREPDNATNHTTNQIQINYTYIEANPDSCWWTNNSGFGNQSLSIGANITGITWEEGNHTIEIYMNDTFGNENSSSITFLVDSQTPSLNIYHPLDLSELSYNTSINLNYSYSDAISANDTCWYHLDSGANTTLVGCGNTTFDASEDSHTIYLYANDTLGNTARESTSFTIALNAPAITIDSPTNGSFLNYTQDVYFNFTSTDGNGLDTCHLWGDFNGTWLLNYTWYLPNSGVMNHTSLNLSENEYSWTIWCNDTTNQGRYAANNFTFTTDTTNPSLSLYDVSDFTSTETGCTENVSLNFDAQDTNLDICWYTILQGNTTEISNTTVSCLTNTTFTSPAGCDVTYTINFYANDSAGNTNFSTDNYYSETYVAPATSPGGGSGSQTTQRLALVNETCDQDADCESQICDPARKLCVSTIEQLCGNNRCDEEYGEDINSCALDCAPIRLAVPGWFVKAMPFLGAVGLLLLFFPKKKRKKKKLTKNSK